MTDVSRILSAIEQSDPSAPEQFSPRVYDELRRPAKKLAHEKAKQQGKVRFLGTSETGTRNKNRDQTLCFVARRGTGTRHSALLLAAVGERGRFNSSGHGLSGAPKPWRLQLRLRSFKLFSFWCEGFLTQTVIILMDEPLRVTERPWRCYSDAPRRVPLMGGVTIGMIPGIDPKIDIAFKKVFGSQEWRHLTMALINAVLQPSFRRPLTDLESLNPYTELATLDDKLSILDIKARDDQGRLFNIEMQMVATASLARQILLFQRLPMCGSMTR